MNKMRPLLGLPFFVTAIVCILLVFASLPVTAADEPASAPITTFDAAEQGPVYTDIYNGLLNSAARINIQKYQIFPETLTDIYTAVLLENPELFYVQNMYRYTYNVDDNTVVEIMPQYALSGSALVAARQTYESELDKIVAAVPEELSELEKVLFVNTYFTTHFSYDTRETGTIFDAYGLFTQKTGVCQAYSSAFIAVMQRLSIPVSYATAENPDTGVGHVWNLVQLNGHWYHIDVTWNDPVPDMPGRSIHTYFLLSDAAMRDIRDSWECAYACTDTTYDNYFWRDVRAPLVYHEGGWYYIDNSDGRIYRYDFSIGTREFLFRITTRWPKLDQPTHYWIGCFSGLAFYDGYLIYNTHNEIFVLLPGTGKSFSIHKSTQPELVCSFKLADNQLTYYLYNIPGEEPVASVSVDLSQIRLRRTVTYLVDGETYATQTYRLGEKISLPAEAPQKVGYVFAGWSPALPALMETADIVVQAVFEEQECAHEHTYTKESAPGCTKNGYRNTYCADCNALLGVESLPAAGHRFSEWIITPAGCTAEGSKTHTCSVCGHTERETMPAMGHDWGEWQVVVEPTATENGRREKVCRHCGEVATEIIPAVTDIGTGTQVIDTGRDTTNPQTQTAGPGTADLQTTTAGTSVRAGDAAGVTVFILVTVLAAGGLALLIFAKRRGAGGSLI